MSEVLTVGSLFSGVGGIDLGLERAGMRIIWQSEVAPYCCKVLAKHWPDVPNLGDVRVIDWSEVETPDLICGGYPCQPFSTAGARAGEADERHLWPYMLDALRYLRPRFALLENVAGHLSLGFGRVLGDLAEIGYDAEWDCIPAAAVGAPHQRFRVFVVAHTAGGRRQVEPIFPHGQTLVGPVAGAGRRAVLGDVAARVQIAERAESCSEAVLADADSEGQPNVQGCETSTERTGRGAAGDAGWWQVEPDVGRMADGVPSRVDRLRALGNAVVPQVAEFVGRQIVLSM